MLSLTAIGQRINETKQSTTCIRELEESEVAILNNARKNIADIENLANTSYSLENNYLEFINYTTYIKQNKETIIYGNGSIHNSMQSIIQETNRLLLNVLFTMTATVEHFKYHLKKCDTLDYEKDLSNLFDNCSEYSFLYKLRNFAQHQCLPITNINISESIIEDSQINVYVSKEELLKYDSWGKIVKPYLKQQTDNFEITSILIKGINNLQNDIFQKWKNKYIENSNKDFEVIKAFVSEIMTYCQNNDFTSACPCLLENIVPLNESKSNIRLTISYFPLQFMNKLGMIE